MADRNKTITLCLLTQLGHEKRLYRQVILHLYRSVLFCSTTVCSVGTSSGRSYFIAVCGFFELSGVLVGYKMIDEKLYFDMFNPTPFWEKAKPIVEGMRNKRPHIYENFELLNNKRLKWRKRRSKRYIKK